jgi:hypothetical protein
MACKIGHGSPKVATGKWYSDRAPMLSLIHIEIAETIPFGAILDVNRWPDLTTPHHTQHLWQYPDLTSGKIGLFALTR